MKIKKKYQDASISRLKESQKEKVKYKTKILGKEFVVYPNVFSPKYFDDTRFFAKEIPVSKGDRFLEIGCGTGVISIFAAYKGASSVTTIDINPDAIANAKENVKLHKMQNKIKVLYGNIFKPVRKQKFDKIFWNVPFSFTKRADLTLIEMSIMDTHYNSLKKFAMGSKNHLKANGTLLIGFSPTLGHITELRRILKSTGYKLRTIKETYGKERYKVKFQIIEAKFKN